MLHYNTRARNTDALNVARYVPNPSTFTGSSALVAAGINRDFKPPDFHLAGEWDLPDVDGVEMTMARMASALTEHAFEY